MNQDHPLRVHVPTPKVLIATTNAGGCPRPLTKHKITKLHNLMDQDHPLCVHVPTPKVLIATINAGGCPRPLTKHEIT